MKVLTVLALVAASGPAPGAAQHRAEPVARPPASGFAVRDLYWRCGAGACTAGESASRPAIVCAALAKRVGRLASFSAGGAAFDGAALERCNAAAR